MAKPFVWAGQLLFPENRPSPIFVVFTSIINFIPMIMQLTVLAPSKESACTNPVRLWLIAAIVTEAINVLFAFYIYMRFSQKLHETEGGAWKTARKLFLYDIGVCMSCI